MFPVLEQIDPLPGREFILERFRGHDVLDPHRNDQQLVLAGERNLFFDFVRIIRISAEHHNHDRGGADRPDDGNLEVFARPDIPAGHPAGQAAILKRIADRLRNRVVFARIAEKD
jgi:hypothetical protein